MSELVTVILTTPIPSLLVVGGILFLFFSIFPIKIIFKQKPSPKQQIFSAIIGFILLGGGISLYLPGFQSVDAMPTETYIPSTDTAVVLPTIEQTPSPIPSVGEGKIAITEVMAAPCGGIQGPNKNEYIELYNYGTSDVDVNGWWIATNANGEGTPDLIVSWDTINQGVDMGGNVITNTSIIPPSTYTVVLSPLYYTGEGKYHMPYRFPKGTILLTLGNSNYLGLDSKSLLGNTPPLSVLILYRGTQNVMDEIVSSYGTPTYGSAPSSVQDDRSDNFPFPVPDCASVERIIASAPDLKSNWKIVENGNPGEGSYAP